MKLPISFPFGKSERIQRGIFHENQHFHFTRKEVKSMAVFRIEKTRDYTVMSNHHLRNTELSLKAKGLLSLMLSLPDGWDYTTKGLARICKDGVDSICAGVQELEKHGYVIRERIRLPNGQLGAIEYTILEQPRPPEPKPEKPRRENPVLDSPVLGKPEQGNPDQLNIDISNTIHQAKIYQLLSNQIPLPPPGEGWDRMGWKPERSIVRLSWRTWTMRSFVKIRR